MQNSVVLAERQWAFCFDFFTSTHQDRIAPALLAAAGDGVQLQSQGGRSLPGPEGHASRVFQ